MTTLTRYIIWHKRDKYACYIAKNPNWLYAYPRQAKHYKQVKYYREKGEALADLWLISEEVRTNLEVRKLTITFKVH